MPDGAIIYRGDTGRDRGRVVVIPVRDCPDPDAAVAGLQARFREFNPDAHVTWRN